ncbi:uncharacterized protein KIAA0930 homolog isoform X2 [Biomphalaria glabrata]|uniref:Uncharacterized protein KIAA0930 homolog isoform X2 n=1 Tax=Biomphalaria glabrata TaxID=6526 RepID=A0A2C9KVC4_BIOGL|nr:uncharacterized protein KIAA0930 homolog isoform X2 [Biomphalaria glabrata]
MAESETDTNLVSSEGFLQKLLRKIGEERRKCGRGSFVDKENGFELLNSNQFWPDMFSQYFLNSSSYSDDCRDDMLFYIRKNPDLKSKHGHIQPLVEVYRRDSKRLPTLTEPTIDWEETVYLNIILHQFEYTLTCGLCTRTDEKNLQILKKFSQRVYPSPSRRSMDSKGTHEEITYPNIFFTVDDFEEAFQDLIVRDSESVAVELTASDKQKLFSVVLFLGSVKYDALKRVYDGRASLTQKITQRMSMGLIKNKKRVEFMKMRGPRGKGCAEMAVSRLKGSGPETPDLENFPVGDFEGSDQEDQYAQRRMSDPSQGITNYVRGSFRRALSMKKSRSETAGVDAPTDEDETEVEAGTLQDELAESEQYNGFWGKSFGQAWHWFKEKKRASSIALNANLTYVMLPWHRIIAGTCCIARVKL